ncbi:MAG: 23S rRNA (pseudouridine(1915)-N(3))-methyltransferase RlmH [Bacteroidia bacterium]
MNIKLVQTGKTHFGFIKDGFEIYEERLKRYCNFSYSEIITPARLKTNDTDLQRKNEGEMILKSLKSNDFVIILDDKGKEYTSPEFARKLEKWLNNNSSLVFIVGGAYGFDNAIYQRANEQLSLSKFVFTHQLVKLILAEQLYRAFTIIKGLPYHHE